MRDHRGAPWLVIIDQLEELITQRPARESAGVEHTALLDALAFALQAAGSLHVVVTVRSDAEPQFHDSALGAWWTGARIAIPGMSRSELREVIERPATQFVLHFEPGQLVDRLVDDVALAPAPLPLLSFALSELYRRCWSRWRGGERGRALRESDYVAMGSVASALTQRATALHDELVQDDPAYAGTIRNVFTRMVAFANGDRARRRVPRGELVYATDDENRRVEAVLDRFHDARLVSLGSEIDETGRIVSYAEPTHDELIRGWTQVTEWLDELDRPTGTRALVNAVGAAASAWIAHQRAVPYLWTDPRVELSAAIRRDRSLVFNADEDAFIGRSLHRRRSQRRRRIGSVAAVVTVLGVVAGVALWQRDLATRNAAEKQRTLALSYQETGRQLLVAGNSLQALPYIVAAREFGEAGVPLRMMFHAAVRTLPLATLEHDGRVSIAVFSPDGSRIATASAGTARVWDARNGLPILCPLEHGDEVTSVAFSHDGRRIVTASDDRTARVWDAATGEPLGPALRHDVAVSSAELSPDGTRVVTASWDHTARLWDAATGAPRGAPMVHRDVVFSAVFSPDGSRVVTASEDDTAQIWDATTGSPLGAPLAHRNAVLSAVFSPDGARVVTASADHHARIWDAATGRLVHELVHDEAVATASFSPDGARVVTVGADGRVRIWDAVTGEWIHDLAHGKSVVAAAFSRDGARVVTASNDRTARIWDSVTGRPLSGAFESAGAVASAAFSPDGSRLVTASADRRARIWLVGGVESVFHALARPGRVSAVFSPDGARVATSCDQQVRVWDATTGKLLAAPFEHPGFVTSIAFSSDGTRVLATSDRGAHLWDVALDPGAFVAWQASAQRGPYALTGSVVAPRGTAIAPLVPDARPVERPGATPALSCPKRRSSQTASAAP